MTDKEKEPEYDPDTGLNRFGHDELQHAEIVSKVNMSMVHDYDGSRRAYADRVSTSEALRNRAKKHKAATNGHGGPPTV